METSEFAVELRKIEEKDNVMENSYGIRSFIDVQNRCS